MAKLFAPALAVALLLSGACRNDELPTAAAQERSPHAESDCIRRAVAETRLNESQARQLCRFSPSADGPVVCYRGAEDRLTVSESQSIHLCQCARGDEPVICFLRTDEDTNMSEQEILRVCSARRMYRVGDDCRPLD